MNPSQIRDRVNNSITEYLEKGELPWHKTRSTVQFWSTAPYTWVNQLLLQIEKLQKQYWSNKRLTFKAIQDKGYSVMKWEKSTFVVFTSHIKKNELDNDWSLVEKKIPYLKYFLVFNQDQTTMPKSEVRQLTTAQEIFDNLSEQPTIIWGQPAYIPERDVITMPTIKDFVSPEAYFSTLFHELSHRTWAEQRLNRKWVTDFDKFWSHQYAKEELIAEMSASFLSAFAGIENTTKDNSWAYIKGWLKSLDDDKNFLISASSQWRKATEYILNGKQDLMKVLC